MFYKQQTEKGCFVWKGYREHIVMSTMSTLVSKWEKYLHPLKNASWTQNRCCASEGDYVVSDSCFEAVFFPQWWIFTVTSSSKDIYISFTLCRETGDVNMEEEYTVMSLTEEPHNKMKINYFSNAPSCCKGKWLCKCIFGTAIKHNFASFPKDSSELWQAWHLVWVKLLLTKTTLE